MEWPATASISTADANRYDKGRSVPTIGRRHGAESRIRLRSKLVEGKNGICLNEHAQAGGACELVAGTQFALESGAIETASVLAGCNVLVSAEASVPVTQTPAEIRAPICLGSQEIQPGKPQPGACKRAGRTV